MLFQIYFLTKHIRLSQCDLWDSVLLLLSFISESLVSPELGWVVEGENYAK